ncbi:endo-1,4-beta-xylanase [Paenibacillus wynnii]|uniref:endo-1,4-beta-xylanase n=1 Tax=Paenibacillus wynnii TaxID=268407 RepID=UPI00278EAD41|nr:endo-1,4-beta-xylanase [Paenibacillus wynnii]MDQ0192073.1 endo-1,4-beta-xylanase [Paenibacillus wynnii]
MSRMFKQVISILLAAGLLIPSGWFAPVAKAAAQDIPVILYHRIVDTATDQWTHTSVDKFRSTMKYLHDNGYTTLTADQYVNIKAGVTTPPAKPILLTFDDGTPDFVTNALPILNQYGMNAVAFIVTGWIGGTYSMSLAELQDLAANHPNISIQNHTVNHANNTWNIMTQVAASAELAQANTYLKGITNKDPVLLAYPYGHFNSDVQAAAAANGIKYSFKVGYPDQSDHAMGRYYVQMGTTLSEIANWIGGPAPDTTVPSDTVTVYHESFASGKGVATQAGGASLTPVTGKIFAGNADGAALYVSNRANNWDATDFKFSDMGLENGKTYTVTASVYVDADVTVPSGSQAYLQTISSYSLLANVNYEAGKAITLTKEFTVDTSKDTTLRVQSDDTGKTVPFYIGDILITAKKAVTVTDKEVYHETFASGKGLATQSGSASLAPITGKVFTGNADGAALYVSDRANNWDAVDFKFSDLGLVNGKTYTVTASVYVDADVTVPSGSQAYLQTISSYSLLANVNYEAGKAITLTKEFTVDTSKDTTLRVQSDDTGKTVPFYIGDVLITEKGSTVTPTPTPEPSRDPALPFTTVTFEDQTAGDFAGRAGTETLTASNEANHSVDGAYALKVEGRTNSWHGPALRVEKYVDKGYEYKVSFWVKMISPASSQLSLSTQVGNTSASYNTLTSKTISISDDWVQLQGTYRYTTVSDEFLTIYVESSNATASFYIDDISFEQTGSGTISVQKDLTPIKDAYQNDFLIGNAVSAADLEGLRLDLLKMHHNAVTAENAMKPDQAYSSEGIFDFTSEDVLVDKILAEGLQLHGHVLVWHQQTPTWLNTTTDVDNNTIPLGREEALNNLRTHIKTVMEHYGDNVISWDVVNEAMNDNPSNPTDWKAALRQAPWKSAIGTDYVEQAFLAAREVLDAHSDWNIKLYYNDYNEDNQNKAQAIYSMVKEINDRYALTHPGKLLIDGVGMQAHYNLNTNPENVKLSLEKFISLGVEVSISELDLTAGSNSQISEQQANAQGYLYAQLMNIFKAHAANISRVTFWGLNDGTSWRASQNPLVFDSNLQAKPAYYGVINPNKFIAEHTPDTVNANQSTANFATPVVDGIVDTVWNQASAMSINRYQMAWQGANGEAKALWDDENLYLLIQVNDVQLNKSSVNAYEQDSVEIFVDQNNAKTTFYQGDDGQFRVNFDNETTFEPSSSATGFESATQISGTNYTVEVKIPLQSVTPANDTKIGFDVQINDAKDGARQSVAAWNDTTGTAYMDTSVYGVLTLTGKPTGSEPTPTPTPTPTQPPTLTLATPAPISTDKDGVVTIKLEVKSDNGRAKGTISNDNMKKALEQATPAANGKKQIVIEVPKQAASKGYEVQLPTPSLKGKENFELWIKTENATIQIPSNMLSNVAENAEQVSIRVDKASTDNLDAATREQIGNRPVIDLNVIAGDKVIEWNNPSASVTVAIPYTPTAEELSNPDLIVIWYMDGKGNATPIPNGRYEAATKSVVFQTTHFSTYAIASSVRTFGDLQNVPWAKQAIDAMAAREVIKGTAENSFSPADSIKRADFIALLVRALELKGTGKNETMFSDVQTTDYYYDELVIAKELGIATGFEDNTYRPNSNISRQDMMVLAVRALAAVGKPVKGSGSLDAYPDAANISDYARDSALFLVKSGVVIGKNNKIAPNDTLTRAEAAVILYRIWNL